jgi:predicted phage terminase large subunit-like protein
MFKRHWFEIVDRSPTWSKTRAKVRFWDFGGGGVTSDYTVGTLMSRTNDDQYYVEDVIRGKYEDNALEDIFVQTIKADGKDVAVRMEQETGASGKLIARRFANLASGHDFEGIPSTEAKIKRWKPFRSECQMGNVYLVRGDWNMAWLGEMQNVPGGKHDDQADSSSGAYSELLNMKRHRGIVVI